MAKKKQTILTPPMILRYGFLTSPSTTHKKEGQYICKCAIKADTPEAEEFQAVLQEQMDKLIPAATADLKPAQRKRLITAKPLSVEEDDETGEETGYLTMSFGMPAKVKRKTDGKVFEFHPDLFDGAGNPIPLSERRGLKIGGGSIVRVAFVFDRPYCMEDKDMEGKKFYKAGVSVDLKAVKILELVEFGPSATSYGFDDEEGSFKKSAHTFDENYGGGDDDIDEDTNEVPEGGDF